MLLAAARRLGALLGHLAKQSHHKHINIGLYQAKTIATDWSFAGINVHSKDTVSCSHVFQPWDFDDFDRLGSIPPETILRQMVMMSYVLGNRYFFEPPKESSKKSVFGLIFIRGQSWEFLPSYYRHLAPCRGITVTERLSFVGNTSWVCAEEMRDSATDELMVRGCIQRINIDANTRGPEPLPDWLKEKYSYLKSSALRPSTVQPFDVQKNCFRYSVVVAPSDTDSNYHTNQAPYIRYCMDCARLGARNGAYSVLRGEIANYDIKRFEVLYQKESLEGDVLDVVSWEDQDSPDTLRFQVKKGSHDITQLTIQFYLPTVKDN